MNVWTPFWRWLALGVLAALTLTWVAQSEAHGRAGPSGPRQVSSAQPTRAVGPCASGGANAVVTWNDGAMTRQVCVSGPNGTLRVNADGTVSVDNGAGSAQSAARSAALQRQRANLLRQEAELQRQDAQLNTRISALQAQLNGLGN